MLKLRSAAVLYALLFFSGCNIFAATISGGEGVPCESDEGCNSGMFCNDGVCKPGVVDAGAVGVDASADAGVIDAAPQDGAATDATQADLIQADGTESDGAEADATEADASGADAAEADASGADAAETDGAAADAATADTATADATIIDTGLPDAFAPVDAEVDAAVTDATAVDASTNDASGAGDATNADSTSADAAAGVDASADDAGGGDAAEVCVDEDSDREFKYDLIFCRSGTDYCDDDGQHWSQNSCDYCRDNDSDAWADGDTDQDLRVAGCDAYPVSGIVIAPDACEGASPAIPIEADNWTAIGCSNCIDGDGDGRGDQCDRGPDCDDSDPLVFQGCGNCLDIDNDTHDGYDGVDCRSGDDYCDADQPDNWNQWSCDNCVDRGTGVAIGDDDADHHLTGCDQPDGVIIIGPDCDNSDPYNWDQSGCDNCRDTDGDGYWFGCDLYDSGQPGPDCAPSVNGLFQPYPTPLYLDIDDDGVGAGAPISDVCAGAGIPPGYSSTGSDCAENDPELWVLQPYFPDADRDGFGAAGSSRVDMCVGNTIPPIGGSNSFDDCDDTNRDIHPGALELPDDDVVQDCDRGADLEAANLSAEDGPGIYVDDVGDCAGDGSMANPYCNIGDALASGTGSPLLIFVAEGTYDEQLDISGSVRLFGGFTNSFNDRNSEFHRSRVDFSPFGTLSNTVHVGAGAWALIGGFEISIDKNASSTTILNDGTLTLVNSNVQGSRHVDATDTSGITNNGVLELRGGEIKGGTANLTAGVVVSGGSALIRDSLIYGGVAQFTSVGIHNQAITTVVNSVVYGGKVSSPTVGNYSAAIDQMSPGGDLAEITLLHDTLFGGNSWSASFGIRLEAGSLTAVNSHIDGRLARAGELNLWMQNSGMDVQFHGCNFGLNAAEEGGSVFPLTSICPTTCMSDDPQFMGMAVLPGRIVPTSPLEDSGVDPFPWDPDGYTVRDIDGHLRFKEGGFDIGADEVFGIYVSKPCFPGSIGTRSNPLCSINEGVQMAHDPDREAPFMVFVAKEGFDFYIDNVLLAKTTGLFGGFNSSWGRDLDANKTPLRPTEGIPLMVQAEAMAVIQGFDVKAGGTTGVFLLDYITGLRVEGFAIIADNVIKGSDDSQSLSVNSGVSVVEPSGATTMASALLVDNKIAADGVGVRAYGLHVYGAQVAGANNVFVGGRNSNSKGVVIEGDFGGGGNVILAHSVIIGSEDVIGAAGVHVNRGNATLINNVVIGGTLLFQGGFAVEVGGSGSAGLVNNMLLSGSTVVSYAGTPHGIGDLRGNCPGWGHITPCQNNLDGNAGFTGDGTYHIGFPSDCADNGTDPSPWYEDLSYDYDIDGQVRPYDVWDIGIDERYP